MSIAKHARASSIMKNMNDGHYVRQSKFSNFGSIPEDSIYYHTMLAEKADKERAERIARSKQRLRAKGLA
tara:strand:+ start:770 stop:979 length:210 start_codon:yes stop_codon:yes gene_type:complete